MGICMACRIENHEMCLSGPYCNCECQPNFYDEQEQKAEHYAAKFQAEAAGEKF